MEKALPSHVQKVKLFCIPSKYCNNKSVTTVLEAWRNYDVYDCSTANCSLTMVTVAADIPEKWPLYKGSHNCVENTGSHCRYV